MNQVCADNAESPEPSIKVNILSYFYSSPKEPMHGSVQDLTFTTLGRYHILSSFVSVEKIPAPERGH